MATIDYIVRITHKLLTKYQTRNPYEICDSLGIRISLKDIDANLKAYYCCQARVRNIVLNSSVSEIEQRILVAHELGHDRLHKDIAMLQGFQETAMFIKTLPTEYEANLFAAELLIDDDELLEYINAGDKSIFGIAAELCLPSDFLDFKFRALKHKGYQIEPLYNVNSKRLF